MKISVQNIEKKFGEYPALKNVSLEMPSGELTALLGPSGSGKTTLLRILAGLETPERGTIRFGDTDVTDFPVRDRNVGFVFQHYALFTHMTAAQNIGFGLKVRKQPKSEIAKRVGELISLMQLEGLESRYPDELSGGQRQRVALARALAAKPLVLLLDEPFGALDAAVRRDLRRWLRRLHDEIHVTTIFVTHDQEEAFEVADRVVILNDGKVEQMGTPDEIFDYPANSFVMDFVGNVNMMAGTFNGAAAHFGPMSFAHTISPKAGDDARAFIRSQDIVLSTNPVEMPYITGTITYARRVGSCVHSMIQTTETHELLEVEIPHDNWMGNGFCVGARVFAFIKRAHIFSERTVQ